MQTPWFMHLHEGFNTSIGIYPTPVGSFMRSWKDGSVEITWYPMGHEFPGGGGREPKRLLASKNPVSEDEIDFVIRDFMHSHPALCLTQNDLDRAPALKGWGETAAGAALQILAVSGGAYIRTHAHGFVSIDYQELGPDPKSRSGNVIAIDFRANHHGRYAICRISDACGDELALLRADRHVRRHMTANNISEIAA